MEVVILEKQIPTKNYVICAVLVVLTVFAVFYARNWYIMTKEYNSDNSPMLKAIGEINTDEISNYILENPRFIIYTSSGLNTDIKNFESKFKSYVIDKNLSQNMVYINTANINRDSFNQLLQGYASNLKTKNKINVGDDVTMLVFENGKITRVIERADTMTLKQINDLFKKYGFVENA